MPPNPSLSPRASGALYGRKGVVTPQEGRVIAARVSTTLTLALRVQAVPVLGLF